MELGISILPQDIWHVDRTTNHQLEDSLLYLLSSIKVIQHCFNNVCFSIPAWFYCVFCIMFFLKTEYVANRMVSRLCCMYRKNLMVLFFSSSSSLRRSSTPLTEMQPKTMIEPLLWLTVAPLSSPCTYISLMPKLKNFKIWIYLQFLCSLSDINLFPLLKNEFLTTALPLRPFLKRLRWTTNWLTFRSGSRSSVCFVCFVLFYFLMF